MKLVVDTNILVSAFIFGGTVKQQLMHILADERIVLLTSAAIHQELQQVLFREKFQRFQAREHIEAQLAAFLTDAVMIPITQTFFDCRDAKDNKFLDLAVSGQADFIITGDQDLRDLHPFQGVNIVTIQEFIEEYLS